VTDFEVPLQSWWNSGRFR